MQSISANRETASMSNLILSCIFHEIHLITVVQQHYMISGHFRTALARMLSGHAFSSDLRRGFANTDVDRDNNVSIGL